MLRKTKHSKDQVIARVTLETPLGPVDLAFSAAGLHELAFAGKNDSAPEASAVSGDETKPPGSETLKKWHSQIVQALEDYFAGKTMAFENLPLDLKGGPFHLRVWEELQKIPPGETVSYGELARRLGNPRASRAVGQACGANPIPLIVPCHRVIASNGSLGGFSAGLERKRWLLAHEQANLGGGSGT
jgi:methylated-DNA-[protein]-cysteine S-methyltransferase